MYNCKYLAFFDAIATIRLCFWWLTDRDNEESLENNYEKWDFKDRGSSFSPSITIRIYLWDNYDSLIGDSEEEITIKNEYLNCWNGECYSFSSHSSYYPVVGWVVVGPSFDKPYPFED